MEVPSSRGDVREDGAGCSSDTAQGCGGRAADSPEVVGLGATVVDDASGCSREKEEQTSALLSEIGLGELSNAHPLSLSVGQQRRLAIATALLEPGPLVILDEPTYGQDRRTMRWVESVITRLRERTINP